MNDIAPLRLHRGTTVHRRFQPFESSFSYKLAMIELDIDRLDKASRQTALFKVERPDLFGFRRKDHGALVKGALRPWAENRLREAGLDVPGGAIRLITFPRHMFYKFAPISLWIAFDAQKTPAAIIYEVRNTFGERHSYVAGLNGTWSQHQAPKSFHVSPFFDVTGQYQFSLQYDGNQLRLGVTTMKDGQPCHMASLSTTAKPATDARWAALALGMPFSTIGVTFGIHWEALKLWLKGARYNSKPAKPARPTTVARPNARHS